MLKKLDVLSTITLNKVRTATEDLLIHDRMEKIRMLFIPYNHLSSEEEEKYRDHDAHISVVQWVNELNEKRNYLEVIEGFSEQGKWKIKRWWPYDEHWDWN